MKINTILVELVTGCVFGFEFVDDELTWVLHIGFIRVMRFTHELEKKDETPHTKD